MEVEYREKITVPDAEECHGCEHLIFNDISPACGKWQKLIHKDIRQGKAILMPCAGCLKARGRK